MQMCWQKHFLAQVAETEYVRLKVGRLCQESKSKLLDSQWHVADEIQTHTQPHFKRAAKPVSSAGVVSAPRDQGRGRELLKSQKEAVARKGPYDKLPVATASKDHELRA